MEIRILTTFVKVAQLKSFSKAAKELGYSQAAITIQIQQLEEELGTRLFERFNKKIELNEEGTLFLTHAQEILQAVESAKSSVKVHKEPQGQLRIGTIESLCTSLFPDLLARYHQRYPKVSVKVETSSPKVLIQMLYQNQLDLIYLLDQPICDAHLCKVWETKEEVVFVCSSNHPLCKKERITLPELCDQDWILTEENASYRCELNDCLAAHDLFVHPAVEVGNTDLIIALLQHSFGVSFLPKSVLRPYLKRGDLSTLNLSGCSFSIYRQLLYHKSKWLTSPMQAMIQMIQNESYK